MNKKTADEIRRELATKGIENLVSDFIDTFPEIAPYSKELFGLLDMIYRIGVNDGVISAAGKAAMTLNKVMRETKVDEEKIPVLGWLTDETTEILNGWPLGYKG